MAKRTQAAARLGDGYPRQHAGQNYEQNIDEQNNDDDQSGGPARPYCEADFRSGGKVIMRSPKSPALLAAALLFVLFAPHVLLGQYNISTVAGGGPNNLAALNASIGYPGSVALDAAGNAYIADSYSSHIFKVTAGTLTIVAGNGTLGYSGDGGPATSAALDGPEGVFVDGSGNIFIADTQNSVIREVVASTGKIQTVAGSATLGAGYSGDGGPAIGAQLNDPFGVFVDSAGDIFIADADNFVIREVIASNGKIQTVAGNNAAGAGYSGDGGPATSALLDFPEGVFVDAEGNIFIADTDNNLIRVVNPGAASTTIAGVVIPPGDINTVAGSFYDSEGGTACQDTGDDGVATTAYLCAPDGVFVDASENIFIADTNNFAIREVAFSTTNIITTVAGTLGTEGPPSNGPATSADLNYPSGVIGDSSGDLYIADTDNFVIRQVTAGNIATISGNGFLAYAGDGGTPLNAELNYPGGVFVDPTEDIFIADTVNSVIREVVAGGNIQPAAGNGASCVPPPTSLCGDGGLAASAQLNNPFGVFLDASGNIFIADTFDNRIRVVNTGAAQITIATVVIQPGDIATVAGTGTEGYAGDGAAATSAELFSPFSVFVDSAENIFIADLGNHVIREVAASTGIITTVAGTPTVMCSNSATPCGDGGPATSAQLSFPDGVFVDSSENIYIADTGDNKIRAVNTSAQTVTIAGVSIPAGDIATVAGTGIEGYSGDDAAATSATLAGPSGVFVDSAGDIFTTDTANFVIREVVGATGFIATIAGNNAPGFSGDGGLSTSAQLNSAFGLFGDTSGNLYVADTDNSRIRELLPTANPTPPSAAPPAAQTTSPGGTATFKINLTANTGNPKYAITLSCLQSSLPMGATCSFSPPTITPGPAPFPFTLSVTVPNSSASLEKQNEKPNGICPQPLFAFVPLAGVLFAGLGLGNKRRRWLLLAGLCVFLILLSACGGGSSTGPTGTTYNVQVQGTTTANPNPVTITTASLTVQ